MTSLATYYNHIKIVLLVTISLLIAARAASGETEIPLNTYGPLENIAKKPAVFRYDKKESTFLTRFNSQLQKDIFDGGENGFQAGMNVEIGNLFSPSPDGFLGFTCISAGFDSKNHMHLKSTVGHFVEALDGDVLLSYRLVHDDVNRTLTSVDSIDDGLYENSFSASYKRYSDAFFLRETSLTYNLSSIAGDEFYSDILDYTADGLNAVGNPAAGYGDTTTHEIEARFAFGYDELGAGLITGLKTSLGFGWEYAIQDEFYDYSAQTEESVSLSASLQQKTVFGLINTSFKYLEESQTISAGYSLKGVDLYLKEIRYEDGSDNRLLGFRIKLNQFDFRDPFKKISNLFKKPKDSNRGYDMIHHTEAISANTLSTLPVLQRLTGS